MDTKTSGLRRGQVLEKFNANRDALRRAYPAASSATAAPATPSDVDTPSQDGRVSLRRFRPSTMKR